MSKVIFNYMPELDSDSTYSPTLAGFDGQELEVVDYETETGLYKLQTESGVMFHAFAEEVEEIS